MSRRMLRDADWERIALLMPNQKGKQGRPRRDDREIIEGILWVLRTGAPWRDLPPDFGPWRTVYTRFNRWTKTGFWEKIWKFLKNRCRQRVTYN